MRFHRGRGALVSSTLLAALSACALAAAPGCGSSSTSTASDAGTGTDTGAPIDGGNSENDAAADAGGGWVQLGFDKNIIPTVVVDPKKPSNVYLGIAAGSDDKGVFRSKDGGKTWTKCAGGLPERFTGSLGIDPQDGSLLAMPGIDGIYRSTDGGETWNQTATEPGGATGFVHHPTNHMVWTVTSQKGVYRSPDGGVTWSNTTNTNLPLNQFGLGPLAYDGAKLYLASDANGVWVSSDNGDSWTKAASTGLPDGPGGGLMLNITATSARPGVVIVQTNAGGIWKSTDSGATFAKLDTSPNRARYTGLRISPVNPTTLFVAADETQGGVGGLLKSTDDGQTWSAAGPPSRPVAAIEIAPDGTTYAGTIGYGLFRLGN
jgi:photosystem II stability/assembly factor-like uncharacterized protein